MTENFDDAATLWDLVERRAAATPDALLLIDESGRTLTCKEFRDRAERAASGFAALGVQAGTRVTWELPNRFETVIASFAASAEHGLASNAFAKAAREASRDNNAANHARIVSASVMLEIAPAAN